MEPILVCNTNIISAVSMGADITSSAYNISDISNYAVQFTWSAGSTPVGTINVLISNDGVNFDLLAAAVAVSGNTGTKVIKDFMAGYVYIKAIYTRTSGSGTLTASIAGKRN